MVFGGERQRVRAVDGPQASVGEHRLRADDDLTGRTDGVSVRRSGWRRNVLMAFPRLAKLGVASGGQKSQDALCVLCQVV